MNNKQSEMFRKILDLNWECKKLADAGKFSEYLEQMVKLGDMKKELRDEMGHAEYDHFIATGQKMFA